MAPQNFHNLLEKGSPWIANALFLPCTAEGLTRESCCQQFVLWDAGVERMNIPFFDYSVSKRISVNIARQGIYIICPHCLNTKRVTSESKASDAAEELYCSDSFVWLFLRRCGLLQVLNFLGLDLLLYAVSQRAEHHVQMTEVEYTRTIAMSIVGGKDHGGVVGT